MYPVVAQLLTRFWLITIIKKKKKKREKVNNQCCLHLVDSVVFTWRVTSVPACPYSALLSVPQTVNMDSVLSSTQSLMQMFQSRAQEFMNEINNVHMVWLEEIQQEANRMFSR